VAERSLVDYVLRGMKRYWDWPVKHADGYTEGIADLSAWIRPAGNIFIELKALERWPARASSPVVLGLEELQRYFIVERRGWLFVRVGREYLLFDANETFVWVDRAEATQAVLRQVATKVWKNSVNWKEFARWVKRSRTSTPPCKLPAR
jgi:hypothetical protein